jgi:hypothetical protein
MAATATETEDLRKTCDNGRKRVTAVHGMSLPEQEEVPSGPAGPAGAGKPASFGMPTIGLRAASETTRVVGPDPTAGRRPVCAVTQYNTLRMRS